MSVTSPNNKLLCSHHQSILNATTKPKAENLQCKETRQRLVRKKFIKGNIILKLRKKMQPDYTAQYYKVCRKHLVNTAVPLPANTCYAYQHDYNYPITMNDWTHLQSSLFSIQPLPIIVPSPSPIFTTHISPLIGIVQPMPSPILPPTFLQDVANLSNYMNQFSFNVEQTETTAEIVNEQTYYNQEGIVSYSDTNLVTYTDSLNTSSEFRVNQGDPIECYLKLPKELFPTPNMLAVDPNPIIDEFCKMPNLQRHMPWILDLEFGIPKSPITRPIPTYNVKLNSIFCKNAPDAIHPGFESCNPDFKRALLFYYDCVVSAWYRGYMIMNCDRSVENFQSWLLLPMQVLGMCWP